MMAEFASAILGLAAFGITIAEKYSDLVQNFQTAPSEYAALSRDVLQIQLVVSRIREYQEEGSTSIPEFYSSDVRGAELQQILEFEDHALREIRAMILDLSKSGGKEVSKKLWMLRQTKAKRLKESLRAIQTRLMVLLNFGAL
jgi:hypothetical protein